MTDPMEAIQRLLKIQCKIIKNNCFELKEGNRVRFTIIESPDNGLKLSIPAGGKAHSRIIKIQKDYKKSCDFLVIVPQNENGMDIYFLEIKETLSPDKNGIPREACKQILFTIPVWEYLVSMMWAHFDIKLEIKKHFVVLAEKEGEKGERLNKQRIIPQPIGECWYRGKNFKVIHSLEKISFSDLKC